MGNVNSLECGLAIERIIESNPKGVTVNEIINKLKIRYDINPKPQTVRNCIAILSRFMPLSEKKENRKNVFYLADFSNKE